VNPRRFVVIGQKARASTEFLLVDIPSTSGRLDVLLRCLRAALLVSHGVRRDTVVYLSLLGLPDVPRTLRFDGAAARYLRPDERSLATVVRKALATEVAEGGGFVEVRNGVAIAAGGWGAVREAIGAGPSYLLEEGAADIREQADLRPDAVFVLGDHVGLEASLRDELLAGGAVPISVGPTSLHSEDVITLVANELDRRATLHALTQ
jgi:tRNA (pseudouridine54-N1)-methyltransferase